MDGKISRMFISDQSETMDLYSTNILLKVRETRIHPSTRHEYIYMYKYICTWVTFAEEAIFL